MKIGSPPKGGFQKDLRRLRDCSSCGRQGSSRKEQRPRRAKEVSVEVTRVSIQGIPKCAEKLTREKRLKSHRRDVPFHVTES